MPDIETIESLKLIFAIFGILCLFILIALAFIGTILHFAKEYATETDELFEEKFEEMKQKRETISERIKNE